MFLSSNRIPNHDTVAVISIETGSIVLTVVRVTPDSKSHIIYVRTLDLESRTEDTQGDILRRASTKIDEIFREITANKRSYLISRAKTLVLLSAPWNLSWREKVAIKRDTPFRITRDFIRESVENTFNSKHSDLSIISTHLMDIDMNGYKLENPIGKLTPSVEFDVFVESAPNEALSVIGAAISMHLPHGDVRFSTKAFASVEALVEKSQIKDFVLVLPEYEMTEIIIVRGGVIESCSSIPIGALSIGRGIFGGSIGQREIVGKMRRFISGMHHNGDSRGAVMRIDISKSEFLKRFYDVLWQMNASYICPSDVFVCGENPAIHLMVDWISGGDYGGDASSKNNFKVAALSGKDILLKDGFYGGKDLPFNSAVAVIAAKSLDGAFKKEKNKLKSSI